MGIFEGKSPTEKKKIIAAGVLCVVALLSLYIAFGGSIFGSRTSVKVTASPTPKTSPSPARASDDFVMPTRDQQNLDYQTTEVVYNPAAYGAPDAGRNIFAFYEPPPPTPYSPTPFVAPVVKPPTPTPTPEIFLTSVNPQSVYAGSRGFRLEVTGERFTPDSRIYFSQSELPTTFVSPQRMVADIPSALISSEGPRQIIIQTPDGKKYSQQVMLNVQAPPKPQFDYIGMIARKRGNNDTAYFQEKGKPLPMSARLNDIVGGRFRLISISADRVVLEDVNLGFKHPLALYRPAPGTTTGGAPTRGTFPAGDGFTPYNPNPGGMPQGMPQSIPGIPDSIPRYIPPPANQQRPETKKDVDDDDNDN